MGGGGGGAGNVFLVLLNTARLLLSMYGYSITGSVLFVKAVWNANYKVCFSGWCGGS